MCVWLPTTVEFASPANQSESVKFVPVTIAIMADAPPAPKKLTKKELRILERQKAAAVAAGPTLTDTYGDLPLIQSTERPNRSYKL